MDTLRNITDGPTIQLIPLREVERILGIGKSTIYRQIAEGKLPKPAKVGASARWAKHEIDNAALLLLAQRSKAAAA
jgi:predicted DNA-binding transcriptional regulator AlpA